MKFDEINNVQKKKDLPAYLIGGIDPEDGRICYLKMVGSDQFGNCVDWQIPLYETALDAEIALAAAKLTEGAVAPFYKVHTQQSIAEEFAAHYHAGRQFDEESDYT